MNCILQEFFQQISRPLIVVVVRIVIPRLRVGGIAGGNSTEALLSIRVCDIAAKYIIPRVVGLVRGLLTH